MLAQKGEICQALAAYCSQGGVNIVDDQEAALAAMAEVFRAAKGDAGAIAATNAKVAVEA